MENNLRQINLLHTNPQQLVLEYQELIRIIVCGFIKSGMIQYQDHDDVLQQVNEDLLQKIPKIREHYRGGSKLKTYFAVVIRNICRQYIRTERRSGDGNYTIEEQYGEVHDPNYPIYLNEEFSRLDLILKSFGEHRKKFEFCLKAVYKFPIKAEDLFQIPGFNPETQGEWLKKFADIHNSKKLEIYPLLTALFNQVEKKEITVDAMRKWIYKRNADLLYMINGNPPAFGYTKETLQILIEKFFEKK